MLRGIGSARTAMAWEQSRVEVISNNVANINTDGFKRQVAVGKEFASILVERLGDRTQVGEKPPAVGSVGSGAVLDQVATVTTQGPLRLTDNPLDVAIQGPGSFTVRTPAGAQPVRNGVLHRSVNGELVTEEGYPVLVQGVPVGRPGQLMTIDENAMVYLDGQAAGRLDLQGAVAGETKIRSNFLEGSNVDLAQETTDLITAMRSFQANQRVLQMQDETLARAVNDLGKV